MKGKSQAEGTAVGPSSLRCPPAPGAATAARLRGPRVLVLMGGHREGRGLRVTPCPPPKQRVLGYGGPMVGAREGPGGPRYGRAGFSLSGGGSRRGSGARGPPRPTAAGGGGSGTPSSRCWERGPGGFGTPSPRRWEGEGGLRDPSAPSLGGGIGDPLAPGLGGGGGGPASGSRAGGDRLSRRPRRRRRSRHRRRCRCRVPAGRRAGRRACPAGAPGCRASPRRSGRRRRRTWPRPCRGR